jgi:hypothetical protein
MTHTVRNLAHLSIAKRRHDGIRPGEKGISPGPLPLALSAVLLTACATTPDTDTQWGIPTTPSPVTRAQLNTSAALRRDVMRHDRAPEPLPQQVDPTLVMDDAILTALEPEQTCMLVTLRTEATFDAPIAQTAPTCLIDDREVPGAVVGEERAAPIERWWEERDRGVDPLTGNVTISAETRDNMVMIVSRVATVCCPDAPYRRLELRLTHPLLGLPPREIYRLKLVWELDPTGETDGAPR